MQFQSWLQFGFSVPYRSHFRSKEA